MTIKSFNPDGRVIGLVLLVVGSVLPWIRTVPNGGGVIMVYNPGMGSGLELWGLIVLPLALLATAMVVLKAESPISEGIAYLTGALSCVIAVNYVFQYLPLDSGPFTPATGVYVTLVGGIIVLFSVGRRLVTDRSSEQEKSIQ